MTALTAPYMPHYGSAWRLPLVPSGRIAVADNGDITVREFLDLQDRVKKLEEWQKEALKLQGFVVLFVAALSAAIAKWISK